ncbi:calcium-binding protein [Pseudaestuariivita sp.]|uniref:calcium-binding protein n=1 Tax=Pseudaestuariivita sp. TaxID=2211669 RepID=UPI00405852EB
MPQDFKEQLINIAPSSPPPGSNVIPRPVFREDLNGGNPIPLEIGNTVSGKVSAAPRFDVADFIPFLGEANRSYQVSVSVDGSGGHEGFIRSSTEVTSISELGDFSLSFPIFTDAEGRADINVTLTRGFSASWSFEVEALNPTTGEATLLPTPVDTMGFGTRGSDKVGLTWGNDTFDAKGGSDVVSGNLGDDSILGGNGNDTLDGEKGNDTLIGGNGRDVLSGGSGDDVIRGGAQADQAYGGTGNDDVAGGRGDDIVFGGAGDDTLSGGRGRDLVDGGAGDDIIAGGGGKDTLIGGDGADTFVIKRGDGRDTIADFASGEDVIDLTAFAVYELSDLGIKAEGAGSVKVSLPSATLILDGVSPDALTDADFVFADRPAPVTSNKGDRVQGLDGADFIDGKNGSDRIDGRGGDDTLLGGNGRDSLTGSEGDDQLFGGRSADLLRGGAGEDTLDGGAGNDVLFGGTGADVFVLGKGRDTARDFEAGTDLVDVSFSGATDISQLTIAQQGSHVRIKLNERDSLQLRDTDVASLTNDDFLF